MRQQVKGLGSLANADTVRTWEYAVDERLNPTMIIDKRKIAWDPTTRHVIADDEWVYEIKPTDNWFAHAKIARKNSKGAKEFWHKDGCSGVETVSRIDGTKTVTTRFTSGALSGQIRNIHTVDKFGNKKIALQNTYDKDGYLLRERRGNVAIEYSHNGDNFNINKIFVDSTVIYSSGLILSN